MMKFAFTTPAFDSKKNEKALTIYKQALENELEEILEKLQNMNCDELENEVDIEAGDCIYEFGKLSDAFIIGDTKGLAGYCIEKLEKCVSKYIEIKPEMNIEQSYIIICAGLYLKSLKKSEK